MEKLNSFITKWQSMILLTLFLFLYFGQCSTNKTISRMRKDNTQLTGNIDSLKNLIQSFTPITSNDLKIEGLKAEKRMIQSVDRRILDVHRQTAIDKEIEALQSNN